MRIPLRERASRQMADSAVVLEGARIGIGHDIHRLVAGRVLTLGGVTVPADVGFATPSDGDVLSHALIDALAGAIGIGDMGLYFPADSDSAAQGARSVEYVRAMAGQVSNAGLVIEHVDSLVTLGTVRLGPHLDATRACLAEALDIPPRPHVRQGAHQRRPGS